MAVLLFPLVAGATSHKENPTSFEIVSYLMILEKLAVIFKYLGLISGELSSDRRSYSTRF